MDADAPLSLNARNAFILIPAGLLAMLAAAGLRFYLIQQSGGEGLSQPLHLGTLLMFGACAMVVGAGCGYWVKVKKYPWYLGFFFGSIGSLTCVGFWIFFIIMLYVPDRETWNET